MVQLQPIVTGFQLYNIMMFVGSVVWLMLPHWYTKVGLIGLYVGMPALIALVFMNVHIEGMVGAADGSYRPSNDDAELPGLPNPAAAVAIVSTGLPTEVIHPQQYRQHLFNVVCLL